MVTHEQIEPILRTSRTTEALLCPTASRNALESVFDDAGGRVRAVVLVSPGNPSGTIVPEALGRAVLRECAARGVWRGDAERGRGAARGRHARAGRLQVEVPNQPVLVPVHAHLAPRRRRRHAFLLAGERDEAMRDRARRKDRA